MGLTQVYSSLYKHGATINVTSKENIGTTFTLTFPTAERKDVRVIQLDLEYIKGQSFKDYLFNNEDKFREILESKTNSVLREVENSNMNEENLFVDAFKIMEFITEDMEHELVRLAQERGELWAKNNLPIILKLEWFNELRGVYWDFLYNYYRNEDFSIDDFFNLQKQTNHFLDLFISHHFTSYNEYKNKLLYSQQAIIEELSVPIIPISEKVAILPIIGTMDTFRAKKLQEKALVEIEKLRLKSIILDLSGVAYMDTAVVSHLFKIIDGFKIIMGCNASITGIRSEVANTMIEMGIALGDKIEIIGDLKEALKKYQLVSENGN